MTLSQAIQTVLDPANYASVQATSSQILQENIQEDIVKLFTEIHVNNIPSATKEIILFSKEIKLVRKDLYFINPC